MKTIVRSALLAFTAVLAAGMLTACASSGASAGDPPEAAAEAQASDGPIVAREDVEPILNDAAAKTFTSASFVTKTETSATGSAQNGAVQTQTMRTTTVGEIDRSGEKPRLHMKYSAMSNMELGKTEYEMFVDSSNLIVSQGDQLYVDAMTDEMLESYADSVTSITSAEEIGSILDMAANYKMTEGDDGTVVTVTVDTAKLAESAAVDDSSLPESTQIATMVVSYVIGDDGRFDTVRLMSSTSGTPTYRVNQTYQFSNIDETTLPEWPDLDAYVAEKSGVKTDASGRMYIEGDDGQIYYVSEIGDDGMIYFENSSSGAEGGGTTSSYGVDSATTTTTTTATTTPAADAQATTSSSTDTSSDKGRAYITADDGTIHYLDEEGSRLIQNEDGTSYFIDADGNFYFLSYEE